MFRITILARGGQGAKIGAEIFAEAYLRKFFTQSSPKFGVERRGAPIEAYFRFDEKFINERGDLLEPDMMVIFDASLINEQTFDNLKNGGLILINTAAIGKYAKFLPQFPFKLVTIDADSIAKNNRIMAKGQPIINIVMLGAINAVLKEISINELLETIKEELPEKTSVTQKALEKNIIGAKEASESIKFWTEEEIKNFTKNIDTQKQVHFGPEQPDEKCTGCKICAELCPKNTIYLKDKKAFINYECCNNCGVCVKVCPQEAIKSGGEK